MWRGARSSQTASADTEHKNRGNTRGSKDAVRHGRMKHAENGARLVDEGALGWPRVASNLTRRISWKMKGTCVPKDVWDPEDARKGEDGSVGRVGQSVEVKNAPLVQPQAK